MLQVRAKLQLPPDNLLGSAGEIKGKIGQVCSALTRRNSSLGLTLPRVYATGRRSLKVVRTHCTSQEATHLITKLPDVFRS